MEASKPFIKSFSGMVFRVSASEHEKKTEKIIENRRIGLFRIFVPAVLEILAVLILIQDVLNFKFQLVESLEVPGKIEGLKVPGKMLQRCRIVCRKVYKKLLKKF